MAGTWQQTRYASVFVQTDRHGKPRYKAVFRDARGKVASRTFTREGQARDFLAHIRLRRATNDLPDVAKSSRTMSELWDHFAKTYRGRPSTFASYESRWLKHIEPALGRRPIGKLHRSEIDDFYADVEARASLETRRKVQQVVHKMLAVAVASEWLRRNPASGIQMPQASPQRSPRVLTDEEVDKLAAAVRPRYRALVYLLAETGARPGEALALRLRNVDGTVRIAEAVAEVRGRRVPGKPKTAGSIRTVPMSPRLRQAMKEHVDAGYVNRFDPESLVFTTERGNPIGQTNLRTRVLQPAAESVGIEGFVPYDLRHTAISLWLMRGLTPWEVAKMVGHTTVAMIEQRYGHLSEHFLQKRVDELSAPLAGAVRGVESPLVGGPAR